MCMLTTQEFQIEKLQLVEAEKKKIRQEYDRKEKQVGIKKKMWTIVLKFLFILVTYFCFTYFTLCKGHSYSLQAIMDISHLWHACDICGQFNDLIVCDCMQWLLDAAQCFKN